MDLSLRSPLGLLTLTSIQGIGGTTAEKLANRFATFGEILDAVDTDFKGVANRTVVAKLRDPGMLRPAMDSAGMIADRADRAGVRMISIYDESYPVRLFDCEPRPPIVYARGRLPSTKAIACTGSRDPTDYGVASASRITALLAEAGWTLVSGLTRGVDSIAMEAALAAGTPAVAVLGTGIDTYSSDRARKLADSVVDAGGCVITEQPFGFEGDQGSMIRRNRLATGLSVASCMLQFALDNEGMPTHAVRYSLLQGRPIFTPVTPPQYACEETTGNEALTDMTGLQLASAIDVKDSIREILERDFAEVSVAMALSGRDDYPALLAWLDEVHAEVEERLSMQDYTPAFA
jgi:Predicted Rossmann fold nucleotide-binding protein involved in DNA uptake